MFEKKKKKKSRLEKTRVGQRYIAVKNVGVQSEEHRETVNYRSERKKKKGRNRVDYIAKMREKLATGSESVACKR